MSARSRLRCAVVEFHTGKERGVLERVVFLHESRRDPRKFWGRRSLTLSGRLFSVDDVDAAKLALQARGTMRSTSTTSTTRLQVALGRLWRTFQHSKLSYRGAGTVR